MLKNIYYKLSKLASPCIFKKKVFLPENLKIVSFTFDDFPVSAIENGAQILEKYNARGTFYWSTGLSGSDEPVGKIAGIEDIKILHQKGHEIGCHTYSHLKCALKSASKISEDCRANRNKMASDTGISPENFAYPFGIHDPISKKTLSDTYYSARTIESGINRGAIDLAILKSVSLYEQKGWDSHLNWLKRLCESGGWLIFYTHDVRESPSPYGISVNLFDKTVKECKDRQIEILTVNEVIMKYGFKK